jgi:signal transduction protein with GAF and PtsI domain
VSNFDLRDISDRLTRSRDTEAVVFEFLGYLQSIRSDCRASLSFYEVSQDALVNLYERQGNRLVRRDILLAVDQLPARLVRKFFHPSAFFNQTDRRALFSHLYGGSPSYVPDPLEMRALAPLTSARTWQSCVCVPLADHEDVLAMLLMVSDRRNAFGSREIGEIIPVKSIAALALSQHLYRSGREREVPRPPAAPANQVPAAAADFQQRLQRLTQHAQELEADNRNKTRQLEALAIEIGQLDQSSSGARQELERVKGTLHALEEQSEAATAHLTEAYSQLNSAQAQMAELQRTMGFLRDACQMLGEEHDPTRLPTLITSWFSETFGVERCSLMLYDPDKEALQIAAQCGIEPELAGRVKVRIGQGIAGWVAHNRRPLLVRAREDAETVQPTGREAYNSDSFISAPLVYNNRLVGVLNLSNKPAGEPFDDADLDRATIASAIMATVLSGPEAARRLEAWR